MHGRYLSEHLINGSVANNIMVLVDGVASHCQPNSSVSSDDNTKMVCRMIVGSLVQPLNTTSSVSICYSDLCSGIIDYPCLTDFTLLNSTVGMVQGYGWLSEPKLTTVSGRSIIPTSFEEFDNGSIAIYFPLTYNNIPQSGSFLITNDINRQSKPLPFALPPYIEDVTESHTNGTPITISGRFLTPNSTVKIGTKECRVFFFQIGNPQNLTCLPPPGVGRIYPLVAYNGDLPSNPLGFSYSAPQIFDFIQVEDMASIGGEDLGNKAKDLILTLGRMPVTIIEIKTSRMYFRIPMVVNRVDAIVEVGGQKSTPLAVRVSPLITSAFINSTNNQISIQGSYFNIPLQVTVEQFDCESPLVSNPIVSDNSLVQTLVCSLPQSITSLDLSKSVSVTIISDNVSTTKSISLTGSPSSGDNGRDSNPNSFASWKIAIIVAVCVLVIGTVIALLVARVMSKKRNEKRKDDSEQALSTVSDALMHTVRGEYKIRLPKSLILNDEFDDPSLLQKIGHGSFAKVYLQAWRGMQVAIKKIRYSQIIALGRTSEWIYDTFLLEIALMEPHFLKLYGYVQKPVNLLLIVMEYCQHGSLYSILHGAGKDDIIQRLPSINFIATCIAEGVGYLHTQEPKILHRDLTSPNILIDSNFNPKISDFGISRFKSQLDVQPMTSIGNMRLRAPEIITGNYDEKIDVFSFGMLLFEMLTRRSAFEDCDPDVACFKVNFGQRPVIPETVNKQWSDLIERCWSQSPKTRPSMAEILLIVPTLPIVHISTTKQ
eukprot:gene15058-17819_t